MKCVICGGDFDYVRFNLCQNCIRPIRQQFTDFALEKFIERYKQQLKLWMEEYMKEQSCKSCGYMTYSIDGTECNKEKNKCPVGYKTKPDPDSIRMETEE